MFLHVVRSDVSPMVRGMSRYAGPPTFALATLAFLALGGAVGTLATSVDRRGRRVALRAAAAGLAGVAATPIGLPVPALVTVLHTIAGATFYLAVLTAMFLPPVTARGRVLRWCLVGSLALFCAGAFGAPGLRLVVGLLQRAVFAVILAWLVSEARQAGRVPLGPC
jgi:Protein of unknown function (DUF998)